MTRYSSPGADIFTYSAALMRLDRAREYQRRGEPFLIIPQHPNL